MAKVWEALRRRIDWCPEVPRRRTVTLESRRHGVHVLTLVFSSFLLLAGLGYFYYLQVAFPTLVPGHGGGERFSLDAANGYTFQIPWHAHTRLHLTIQSDSIKVYVNHAYVCNCIEYELVIEPGGEALITLKSNSPASGSFAAWQETPWEVLLLAAALLAAGLVTAALSAAHWLTRFRVLQI